MLFHRSISWIATHKRQAWIGGGVLVAVAACIVVLAVSLPAEESLEVGTTPGQPTLSTGTAEPQTSKDANVSLDEAPGASATKEEAEEQVLLGMIVGQEEQKMAEGFGVYAESLMQTGDIHQYLIYTAVDDENQQIQDVRSLLNQGCGAIVVAGVDDYTFEIICQLADKADVPVIAIEAKAETGYTVNITAADWTQAYLTWMEETLPAGSTVGVLATKDTSAFSQEAAAGLKAPLSLAGTAYQAEENFEKQRETLLKSGPDGLLVEGSLAADAVYQAATLGGMPRAVAADATAGLIRQWYALKNGGISLPLEEETPAVSEGDEAEEPNESPTATPAPPKTQLFTAPDSQFYGGLALSQEVLGEAACRFAFQFATGGELKEKTPYTYALQAKEGVTEENLAAYYKQAQDKEDDAQLVGEADLEGIAKLFQ